VDQRKRRILQAVTEDYIASAEPVGSRTIARKYQLGVSPATIRNEMADLEEAGYLEQPHTSAGRIPSDKGYRYYVDALLDPVGPSAAERRRLHEEVFSQARAVEELIHRTARMLSLLTQYTSFVVTPRATESVCRHFQLIALDPAHLLVVLVIEPGFVQHRIVEIDSPIAPEEMALLNAFLGERLRGVTISDVTATLISELREVIRTPALFYTVMELLTSGLDDSGDERIFVEGATNIFEHPEFQDVERARAVLALFDEPDSMHEMVNTCLGRTGVVVTIGRENVREEMQECSVVTATVSMGGRVVGSLGLLGPTRMDYARVLGVLEFVADGLSEILTDFKRR
jgi:heat-inducible transcriptional repressor